MLRIMRKLAALSVLTLLAAMPARGDDKEGFVSIFNGKNLDGWSQKNGTATYRVEDGTVVGKTSEGSPNSFLCSGKEYGDFELKFEVQVDDELNSGVQIRSASRKDKDNGRVHGPQVEIATNGTAGCVYGESLGTGWLSTDMTGDEAKKAFKKDEWNSYRVLAVGSHIQTWVNGVPVVDFQEDKSGMKAGFIGLQVHGIAKGAGPFQVRWRNITIREIKQ